ncbi:HGC1 [Candida margitis]|uniref:HGC1 n=1 Tax=Candida margitis TaxID=1775924 RepID=UPI00222781C2|nr:HGC1 [Candida margitis]KAI5956655.1 HGC1 [Candida margitis]
MIAAAKQSSPNGFSLFPQNKRTHYPGLSQHHQAPLPPPPSFTPKQFEQELYSSHMYSSEISTHEKQVSEYDMDIYETMLEQIEQTKPNVSLYKQQPYLTPAIRVKLVEFLLKMSVRLKILPFVFYKAVRLFDRYCCKRIVLLDQSQLIITTCLWIASKINGGNNHFVNLNNLNKCADGFRVIGDLGYGSGGKFIGPTERFRLPKLHELVKLCGAKCKYDVGMFKQMELHIMTTLDWSLCDPSIEEFIVKSNEFCTCQVQGASEGDISTGEMFKVKEYLSYISLYSFDLVDVSMIEVGQVISDLINDVFRIDFSCTDYQIVQTPTTLSSRSSYSLARINIEMEHYKMIKKCLIKSILNTSEYMLSLFDTSGPQYMYRAVVNGWAPICNRATTTRVYQDYTAMRSGSFSSSESFSAPSPTGSACSTNSAGGAMNIAVTPPIPFMSAPANAVVNQQGNFSTPPDVRSKYNFAVQVPNQPPRQAPPPPAQHATVPHHSLPLPHYKSTPQLKHFEFQNQQQQPQHQSLRVNTNLPQGQSGSFSAASTLSSSYPSATSSAVSSASTQNTNVFDRPIFMHSGNGSSLAIGEGSCISRSSTPMSDIDTAMGANKSPGSIYMAMERMKT